VAGLSFERREKVRHKATLFGMYVRPACRGRGLGEQLLQAVLAAARARDDLQVVQLTVTQGNTPAVALYEAAGFVTYGCEPLAVRVGEGFVSKLHMRCNLR
jgi:ribosomal protein S18 acetylase RimI-like enzyme